MSGENTQAPTTLLHTASESKRENRSARHEYEHWLDHKRRHEVKTEWPRAFFIATPSLQAGFGYSHVKIWRTSSTWYRINDSKWFVLVNMITHVKLIKIGHSHGKSSLLTRLLEPPHPPALLRPYNTYSSSLAPSCVYRPTHRLLQRKWSGRLTKNALSVCTSNVCKECQ